MLKNPCDVREYGGRKLEVSGYWRNQNTIRILENVALKAVIRPLEKFTPLNIKRGSCKTSTTQRSFSNTLSPRNMWWGNEPEIWCKYHKIYGQHTYDCHNLKQEIEKLSQEDHLQIYIWGNFWSLEKNHHIWRYATREHLHLRELDVERNTWLCPSDSHFEYNYGRIYRRRMTNMSRNRYVHQVMHIMNVWPTNMTFSMP